MTDQLSLLPDRPVKATLLVLVTLEGKERGGPGAAISLAMTEEEWQKLLHESTYCGPSVLVQLALRYREG
jgi:hypothetical protein